MFKSFEDYFLELGPLMFKLQKALATMAEGGIGFVNALTDGGVLDLQQPVCITLPKLNPRIKRIVGTQWADGRLALLCEQKNGESLLVFESLPNMQFKVLGNGFQYALPPRIISGNVMAIIVDSPNTVRVFVGSPRTSGFYTKPLDQLEEMPITCGFSDFLNLYGVKDKEAAKKYMKEAAELNIGKRSWEDCEEGGSTATSWYGYKDEPVFFHGEHVFFRVSNRGDIWIIFPPKKRAK